MTAPTPTPETIRIQPTSGWRFLDLRELLHYRELAGFLAWRDIKVRYKQTAIGVAWVVLQPLLMMLVFWLFFGKLAKLDQTTEGVPYPLFALAGLLPWQLFSRTLNDSGNSLVTNQRLITKIYFPRLIVPIATTLAALLDFAIGLLLLAGALLYFKIPPTLHLLCLPLFLLLMLATALGVGFWLAALNTEYRDVMYAVPFLTQLWMFVTPVVYPAALVPERLRWLLGLNPMTGVVEGFRWCLLAGTPRPGGELWLSAGIALLLLLSGIAWFRWRERTFIDTLGG
ncbi:MAG: ABC transporter permease [Lentisphaeria bacterium]